MENKRQIQVLVYIPIGPFEDMDVHEYGTWENLLKTKDILPTDEIIKFVSIRKVTPDIWGFGNMDMDESPEYIYAPGIMVKRRRIETDDEYVSRLKIGQTQKDRSEERDHLEYLRLKAKFEK